MSSPPPSSSLRDLLARERSEPRYELPSPPRRTLSRRHASPPRSGDGPVDTVVSMLSGYAGRFSRDPEFRRALRDKCAACLAPAASASAAARREREHAVLADLELALESVERLADAAPSARGSKVHSLRNSIRLLGVVASLHAPRHAAAAAAFAAAEDHGYTCGVPDAHLAACAQLYLAIVYKMELDSRLAARHLLQVFVDAPRLARETLLPDLWAHVFLPHLLHLEVWLADESELVAGCCDDEADGRSSRRMKTLQRLYDDQMDSGTAQFATYYKEWLKCGGDAPRDAPSVPLPSMPGDFDKWEKHSLSLRTSSISRNLYNAVFGTSFEQEDVKDAKLPDKAGFVLDMDVQLDENPASLKMEKLAHTEKHGATRKAFRHSERKHCSSRDSTIPTQVLLAPIVLMPWRSKQECY